VELYLYFPLVFVVVGTNNQSIKIVWSVLRSLVGGWRGNKKAEKIVDLLVLWHKFKYLENTSQICGRKSRENEFMKDEIP